MIPWATRLSIIIVCGIAIFLLVGCSALEDDVQQAEEQAAEDVANDTAESLYERALASFAEKEYKGAIEEFEAVEQQHPYSEWAKRGQIMAAYSAYRVQEFDTAISILERFAKLHPNHPSTPYAYYLRALSYYDQISDVGRDQKMTQEARQALREVVGRYPDSNYARDAQLKLELTEDHLAGKEMEIGRYYLMRDEYLASINRFKRVVEQYQTTSHIPEALHRLVEAYMKLGVRDEAEKYAAVLGYNYPGSEWYEYSYALLNPGQARAEAGAKDESWYEVF
tara:strand:- start:102 stop:944 length:843 start_codon:yes stop_codon:yes gene_type:complete